MTLFMKSLRGAMRLPFALFCLTAWAGPAWAQSGAKRPVYQMLRQNENWSALEESPARGEDFFDPIKYVPLNESGSVSASFGGHYRVRMENWDNFAFSDAAGRDDSFTNTRLTLHGDIRLGGNVRFFVEGKTALATDRNLPGGRRPLDIDSADLLNAFVDLSLRFSDSSKFTFRVGRQELLFGKQRLVSPLPWGNSFRTFEGVSGELKVRSWKVTGFWTHPVKVNKYSFNRRDSSTKFFGAYAAGRVTGTGSSWDIYWLDVNRRRGVFNGMAGHEKRHTVGSRIGGKIRASDFDYDVEAAYQFGTLGAANIEANMVASVIGYTFVDAAGAPRLHAGFDYASGDDGPGGKAGTFSHLFPLGHAYFGHMDAVARQNVIDFSGGVTLKPARRLTVSVKEHNFQRASKSDALYNAGARVIRAAAPGAPASVGSEIDLMVKYKAQRHVIVGGGWGHFFAGKFLEATGPAKDVNFAYMWLQYTL